MQRTHPQHQRTRIECVAGNWVAPVMPARSTPTFPGPYVAGLIKKDPVFKSKIQVEAENLNILKKGATLPI